MCVSFWGWGTSQSSPTQTQPLKLEEEGVQGAMHVAKLFFPAPSKATTFHLGTPTSEELG